MKRAYDVIIIGGSYAGLAAAMALGRSLRSVLVIDAGKPANRFTPYSHNFITHDGTPPTEIAEQAKLQVMNYPTITWLTGVVAKAKRESTGFIIHVKHGEVYRAGKLVFATGITDILPNIPGYRECWGKSVLHCPYCHGYEVRNARTGILGNGDYAFEFGVLISNWTRDLTIFTNGKSTLTDEQNKKLTEHGINIMEDKVMALYHTNGNLNSIEFEQGKLFDISVLYTRPDFSQHCAVPEQLGCELTPEGYIQINANHQTSVAGVFACGDNVTRLRTVANAVSMGTTTGMIVNKELIFEKF